MSSSWTVSDILEPGAAIDYGASLIGVRQRPLPTGLRSWDVACDETGGHGLGDWWYVVVGGASNAGKTQLAVHLARQAAEGGHVPGLITMEVPRSGLQRRLYSHVTSFTWWDFLPRRWDTDDAQGKVDRLAAEVTAYRNGGDEEPRALLVAEHERPPTLPDIMAACTGLHEAGATCILVDHLQLIRSNADEIADRATEISDALRWFAHGKHVLVIALSQLNRMASRERDRRPTMHDLLGGTSIESNANQVILLDHSQTERDPDHPHLLRTWLYLDKNREGPNRLMIPVEADFRTGRWREAEPDEVDSWPGARKKGRAGR
jgi:replicative DNA helicase